MSDDYGDVDVEDNYVDDLRDERDALTAQLAKARAGLRHVGVIQRSGGDYCPICDYTVKKCDGRPVVPCRGRDARAAIASLDTPSPAAERKRAWEHATREREKAVGVGPWQDTGHRIGGSPVMGVGFGPTGTPGPTAPAGPTPGIPLARTAREVAESWLREYAFPQTGGTLLIRDSLTALIDADRASRGIPMGLDPVGREWQTTAGSRQHPSGCEWWEGAACSCAVAPPAQCGEYFQAGPPGLDMPAACQREPGHGGAHGAYVRATAPLGTTTKGTK